MKKQNVLPAIIGTIILAILCAVYFMAFGDNTAETSAVEGDFTAQFIDVGQGDGILLTCNGESAIIDAGTPDSGESLIAYLKSQNIGKPKFVFASHAHADHIGAMAQVVDTFGCEKFIMPKSTANTRTFERLLDSVEKSGAEAAYGKAGDRFGLGGAEIEILSPPEGFATDNLNDTSLVLLVKFEGYSFLLTGDSERVMEAKFENELDPVTVLKVGHHGSRTSSSHGFLERAKPQYSVISCGKDNSYGHPHEETVKSLNKIDSKILRTDENGTIAFKIEGGALSYETER